jgi:hypothetical protein
MGLRGPLIAFLAGCLALAGTATAQAATTRIASPTGTGVVCSDATPCSIGQAVGASADGDTVLLKPGPYTLAPGGLSVNTALTMQPQVAGTRVELKSITGDSVGVFDSARLQDLLINVSGLAGSDRALTTQTGAAIIDRVAVIAQGPTGTTGVLLKDGSSLLNSTVWAPSNSSNGVVGGGTGGTIRNSTIIASGTPSSGVDANGAYTVSGPQTVTVQNSIVRSATQDLFAGDGPGAVALNVDHSSYVTNSTGTGGTITDLGGHQTAAPLFANATAGDFHELLGSPTIDAGALVGGLSALDYDGGPRIVNSGSTCVALPDIGADEFATDTTPASCHAVVVKKKKCKKKKKHRHHAAAAKKKKCKKKKKRK